MEINHNILNRLTISLRYFEKSDDFIKELSNTKYATLTYEALLVSAIIFYAGPFSDNQKDKGGKTSSKLRKDVLKNLTREQKDFHDEILKLRNKAIAHGEWEYHPTSVIENGIVKSMPFNIWKYFKGIHEIIRFQELVEKVRLNTNHLITDKLRVIKETGKI